jgi:hypothetical protein
MIDVSATKVYNIFPFLEVAVAYSTQLIFGLFSILDFIEAGDLILIESITITHPHPLHKISKYRIYDTSLTIALKEMS